MALKFPDRLESNNPEAYGIIRGDQIAGSSLIKISSDTSKDILYSDINDKNSVFGKGVLIESSNVFYNNIGIISTCTIEDDGNVKINYFNYFLHQNGISFGGVYTSEDEHDYVDIGIRFFDPNNNNKLLYSLKPYCIQFGTNQDLCISRDRISFYSWLELSTNGIHIGSNSDRTEYSNNTIKFINQSYDSDPSVYNGGIIFLSSDTVVKLNQNMLSIENFLDNKIKIFIGTYNYGQKEKESLISIDDKIFITEKGFLSTNYNDDAIFGNGKILLPLSTTEIDNLFT